jgi:hypothetical protein
MFKAGTSVAVRADTVGMRGSMTVIWSSLGTTLVRDQAGEVCTFVTRDLREVQSTEEPQ